MKSQKLIVIFAIPFALAAMVALLGLAVPTAALAQTEINPGETLSDLDADGGNITGECEPSERIRSAFAWSNSDLDLQHAVQLFAEAGPTAHRTLPAPAAMSSRDSRSPPRTGRKPGRR